MLILSTRNMSRQGRFVPKSLNKEERTVEVCWTTGAKVLRRGKLPYYEELSLKEGHVNLDRLNDGAAVLNAHRGGSLSDQIGVVEKAWIEGGKGYAKLRFSERDEVTPFFKDIEQGIIRNVSVGYVIEDYDEPETEDEIPTVRAIKWEPYEISFTPIQADKGGKVRSMGEDEKKDELVKKERKRASEIVGLCRKFDIPEETERQMIDSGCGLDEVRSKVLEFVADKQNVSIQKTPVEIVRDEKVTKREGMQEALMHRAAGSVVSEKGRQYVGMSLVDMARTCIGANYSTGKMEIAQRAFHSTSDFPEILGNVARQTLLTSYEKLMKEQEFAPLIKVVDFPDFKPKSTVRLGEKADLLPLPELSEYKSSTLSEESDAWSIGTYGRKLGISRQMIINDDLGAFDSIGDWAGAISRLESRLFWEIFNNKDYQLRGKKLFNSEYYNNLIDGDLSIDALSQARLKMGKQQGLDERVGDYLGIKAKYLIVPLELETKAEQFVSSEVVPQKPDEVNPFKNKYTVISTAGLTDPSNWFMAADKNQGIPLIEAGYLNGNRTPFVEYQRDFNTDGLEVKVRHDVGFKAADYRGLVKVVPKVAVSTAKKGEK